VTGAAISSLAARKAALRREAKARRAVAARAATGDAPGEAVCRRVLDAIPIADGAVVSAYWPMDDELDPRPLMRALHARGCTIGLPVVVGRGHALRFRRWRPGDVLHAGGFGTQVPGDACPEVRPRVLLVPLLAFDRAGYRLGYGGGFYDRTLAGLRAAGPLTAVGLAYGGQEVPQVPRDATDQRLDWIVTEAETIEIPGESP